MCIKCKLVFDAQPFRLGVLTSAHGRLTSWNWILLYSVLLHCSFFCLNLFYFFIVICLVILKLFKTVVLNKVFGLVCKPCCLNQNVAAWSNPDPAVWHSSHLNKEMLFIQEMVLLCCFFKGYHSRFMFKRKLSIFLSQKNQVILPIYA